ncbi:DDE-type integrase/transposase/recombinase [Streptomyces viridiviolaceus]|uniref:DDE-type integrase/transposase/recombinase n=1 Tax=Streptomyces viridiviolaceus TaxID=68282 RepID=A0ABW2E9T9_9ACTN
MPDLLQFLCLATVIDVHSRRLLGWSMADHMRTQLDTDALDAAVCIRGGQVNGVVVHSDHGDQYSLKAFAGACRTAGIRRSVGPSARARTARPSRSSPRSNGKSWPSLHDNPCPRPRWKPPLCSPPTRLPGWRRPRTPACRTTAVSSSRA